MSIKATKTLSDKTYFVLNSTTVNNSENVNRSRFLPTQLAFVNHIEQRRNRMSKHCGIVAKLSCQGDNYKKLIKMSVLIFNMEF